MHAPNDDTALPRPRPVVDGAGDRRGRQPAVTITNLVKRYGSLLAVDDVSFSIQEGEIFGIIGPNGAGKTTTVECMCDGHTLVTFLHISVPMLPVCAASRPGPG